MIEGVARGIPETDTIKAVALYVVSRNDTIRGRYENDTLDVVC
jgi:hypothetical protein